MLHYTSRVRPICIFNSNGTPELNQGADEYLDLERFEVTPVPENYGFNITLHGKRHLKSRLRTEDCSTHFGRQG